MIWKTSQLFSIALTDMTTHSFTDLSEIWSQGLLNEFLRGTQEVAKLEKPPEPDLVITKNGQLSGYGEVKTLVDGEELALANILFKMKLNRIPLPPGCGFWTVTAEKEANLRYLRKSLLREVKQWHPGSLPSDYSILKILTDLGFKSPMHHKDADDDIVFVNPSTRIYTPIAERPVVGPIVRFALEEFDSKLSIETMKMRGRKTNHLFLWPCDSAYPELVFAAFDNPDLLPDDALELPDWLDYCWIGHKFGKVDDQVNAWLWGRSEGWQLVSVKLEPR